jgi:ubiquitin C-terminal hydrolase
MHDSHEFMVFLLEQLQNEELPKKRIAFDGSDPKKSLLQICEEYKAAHPTIIDQLFSGISQTIVRCAKCKYESLTCNPFMTLSLTFNNNITRCIREQLAEDTISGTYTCDKCH